MKRNVTLTLGKEVERMWPGAGVKIVIGDTDYGNMRAGDSIRLALDENVHIIDGILLGQNKAFAAMARFKIVEVEGTTDDLFYSFELKQGWKWKATCTLTHRTAMISEERYVDKIIDLIMEARNSSAPYPVRSELVELLEQTEYFFKRNRRLTGIYCMQLNEVAKAYVNRFEIEKALEMALQAETYAKQIIEEDSSFYSSEMKKRAEEERIEAMITQAYSLFYKDDTDDNAVLKILENCPNTIEIDLLKWNSMYRRDFSHWDHLSVSISCESYQSIFSFLIDHPSALKKENYIRTSICIGALNCYRLMVVMDDGGQERACRFLERSTVLFQNDDFLRNKIYETIKEARRNSYYGY